MRTQNLMKGFVIAFITIFLFFGCSSLFVDKQEVLSSYSLIYSIFLSKGEEQKFIDKATEVLNQLKHNSSYKTNIQELKMLLDNALEENKITLKALTYTKSVEGDFGFKVKGERYVAVLKEVNLGEFTAFIQVLESDVQDKYAQSVRVLEPAMSKIKKVELEFQTAGDDIVETYGLKHVEL